MFSISKISTVNLDNTLSDQTTAYGKENVPGVARFTSLTVNEMAE